MPAAAEYPFLSIFWTMIIFFAWVIWIWMMIAILTDVFRRRDTSGWGKAAWTVFLIALPFLGALPYLIINHDGMAERSLEQARARQSEFDDDVKSVGSGGRRGRGDRERQAAARLRRDHPGRVRRAHGQGAGVGMPR